MSTLTDEKIKECKIIFDLIDKDKDTKITAEELGPALRACGASPSQQELEMAIQSSGDKSNLINFEKFIDLYEKLINNQDSEEDIINELKKLDKNGEKRKIINPIRTEFVRFYNICFKKMDIHEKKEEKAPSKEEKNKSKEKSNDSNPNPPATKTTETPTPKENETPTEKKKFQ